MEYTFRTYMEQPIEINRIHRLNCLKGLELMDTGIVDVVVTSPPYNIGVAYRTYEDRRSREEYLAWMEEVAIAVKRVM